MKKPRASPRTRGWMSNTPGREVSVICKLVVSNTRVAAARIVRCCAAKLCIRARFQSCRIAYICSAFRPCSYDVPQRLKPIEIYLLGGASEDVALIQNGSQ